MKNEVTVCCGSSGLKLIASPLYLGDGALTQRVTALDGSSFTGDENGHPTPSFPAIRFFSIPKHLLEVLWLEEIPKLTGLQGSSSEATHEPDTWPGLDTLAVLLETIDDGFIKPVDAVFQSAAQTLGPREDRDRDICEQAVTSAPRLGEPRHWQRAAWLNLDEHSHRAHIRIREPENRSSLEDQVFELEIATGEGILWQRRLLQVKEAGSNMQEATNKLILLSGNGSDR